MSEMKKWAKPGEAEPTEVCSMDTETTGLSKESDEIVEIYIVKANRYTGEVIGEFLQRCRPLSGMIPEGATKVHGITYEMVKDCPAFFEDGVQKAAGDFMRGCVITGYNTEGYDFKMCRMKPKYSFDCMKWFKEKFPRNAHKLINCCNTLKIKFDSKLAHGAKYDALRALDIYWKATGEGQPVVDAFVQPVVEDVPVTAEQVAVIDQALTQDPVVGVEEQKFYDAVDQAHAEHVAGLEVKPALAITKDSVSAVEVVEERPKSVLNTDVAAALQADAEKLEEAKTWCRINLPLSEIERAIVGMPLSFSKMETYIRCPYKFYKSYVEKYSFERPSYFASGTACHLVAERSAVWCFREAFARRFEVVMQNGGIIGFDISLEWEAKVKAEYEYYGMGNLARWLHDHPLELMAQQKIKRLSQLILCVADLTSADTMADTAVYSPDEVVFEQIINQAIIETAIVDSEIINDVRQICKTFKRTYRFDTSGRAIILSERKACFEDMWKYTNDWYSKKAKWRSIIDYIEYHEDHVVIRDYKTSRTCKTEYQLKEDMQLKCYVASVMAMIPAVKDKPIRVEMVYLRFGIVVGFDVVNNEALFDEVDQWIRNGRAMIEAEVKKPVSEMFAPVRNTYCSSCDFCSHAMCPLFRKDTNHLISSPETFVVTSPETCAMAWKQIEANDTESDMLKTVVKAYLNSGDGIVVDIDEKGKLGFYQDKQLKFLPSEASKWLLKQAVAKGAVPAEAMKTIIDYMSMPKDSFSKLCDRFGIMYKDEELDEAGITKLSFKRSLGCRCDKPDGEEEQA